MKIFLSLILLPLFAYSQIIYDYKDDKSGKPNQIANINGTDIIRVNGCTKPSFVCSTGFSGKSFSKDTTYNPAQPGFEFSVTPDQGYTLNITYFEAKLRRSDQGSISVRYAQSTDGGVTWVDNGENLTPKNSGCGDAKKREWDIEDFSFDGKVIFRITGFDAKSGSGVLQVLNIIVHGTVIQTTIDNDGDGYTAENDCNDSDSTIHPNAIEKCNDIDDNCDILIDNGLSLFKYYEDVNKDGFADDSTNFILTCNNIAPDGFTIELAPRIDLSLTNTNITVPQTLWTATLADLFYTGSVMNGKAVPRFTTDEPIYGLVEGLNWYGVSMSEGVATWWDAVLVGDSSVLRPDIKEGSGCIQSGYNCCQYGALPIGGACTSVFKINGQLFDAFNDYVSFLRKSQRKSIVTLNVVKGKSDYQIEQAAWKIKQAKPIALLFGQETNSDGVGLKSDAKRYTDTCNNIINALTLKSSNTWLVGDAADIWLTAKKHINWNKYLAANSQFNMFDMYLQLDESTEFNGELKHDTTDLNTVPATHTKWFMMFDTMFNGRPLAATQINTSEVFHDEGAIVYEGQFMAGAYLILTYMNMMNYNVVSNNKIQVGIWQTIKNVTGKSVYDLNGKFLVLLSNLFKEGSTYLTVTEESGAQIFGVKQGDEYKLIFLNKTGKELAMPKSVSLDGYIINNVKWTGSWLYSDKFTSKEALQYDNVGFLKGLSLGYATIKIPN